MSKAKENDTNRSVRLYMSRYMYLAYADKFLNALIVYSESKWSSQYHILQHDENCRMTSYEFWYETMYAWILSLWQLPDVYKKECVEV